MLSKCPYCKATFEEGEKHLICPYCGEELPKNSSEKVDCSTFKPDAKKTNIKPRRKKEKSFLKVYINYSKNRAYLNMFVCPIIGIIIAIFSIIGFVLYGAYALFILIFSVLLFLVGIINWLYYKHHSDEKE